MMMQVSSTDLRRYGRSRGFTLIELMIVVVVVALLAAIALPSFMSQVRASRRSDAVATLSQIQQAQERWRSNCPCYSSSLTVANTGCPATDCANSSGLGLTFSTTNYTYAMSVAPAIGTPNTYTITATGQGGQASDRATGSSCATLTVSVTNSVPVTTPAACWRR